MSTLGERIADMRKRLESDQGYREPDLLAYMMRDWPEVQADENLSDLMWALADTRHGMCHRNDLIWVLERLERQAQ